jgi:hypothetical protein
MSEGSARGELEELVKVLPADVRGRAAGEWSARAQAEHASIASFARFALELLAVGAPAILLEGAHRAALDEIEHARLSFELASVYAREALGPGPLPLAVEALGARDLASVVASTVEEGCVAETLAAVEAQAAGDAAKPRAVRDVLTQIARDEAAHASLAYEFVAWALAAHPGPVSRAARSAFDAAIQRVREEPVLESARDDALREHGCLPAQERRAVRLRALAEVIEPAFHQLFAPR